MKKYIFTLTATIALGAAGMLVAACTDHDNDSDNVISNQEGAASYDILSFNDAEGIIDTDGNWNVLNAECPR